MDGPTNEFMQGQFPSYVTGATGYTRDSFGRILTATPTTLFTTSAQFTNQSQIIDYVSTGTGAVFVDVSNTIVTLSASGSGGRAVRQSREYLLYQPGKPQLFTFTFTPQYSGTFDTSVAVRAGIYDDYRDKNTAGSTYPGAGVEVNQTSMGQFFELSGNQWFVVERANSSNNSLNVTRIPQSNWNVDTLNGDRTRSPSGYILPGTPSTPILCFIERQWLGVGAVRMGVYFAGRPVTCHTFQNRILQRPYTHLAKLPLRWELEKVSGGSASAATMASICGAVHSIGSYSPFGTIFSLPISISAVSTTVDTTPRPLVVLRLQQAYCRATLKLKAIDVVNNDTNPSNASVIVYKNPSISGAAFSYVNHPDTKSMVQYYQFPTYSSSAYTISGGTPTRGTFAGSRSGGVQETFSIEDLVTAASYCSDIKGNCDTLVVVARAVSGTCPLSVNLTWVELE